LFADLAGFTALTEAHGDQEAADLAAEFGHCLRALLPEHRAQEVKTLGDAMMIRVADAGQAIELGLRIVDELGTRPRFPIVRVGMHTGPAIQRRRDWFGAAVNLAARVAAAAGGNEVLLTQATHEAAGEPPGIDLERHGHQRFKNVRDEVTLYRALRRGEQRAGLPVDPVCRMAVTGEQAAGRLRYQGRDYHFCSLECAGAFAAAPERYASQPGQEDQ
jgi:class 3 adenylate cyclase/YHS domain-containing protein